MSEKIVLELESRKETGKAARGLRALGKVPAVMYGHGAKSSPLAAPSRELEKVFARAGGNQIVELKIDGSTKKNAIIHDVQMDVRTGHIVHADFYLVRMDEKIKASVPLHFTGESTAVYQQEGTLLRPLEAIEVEALPGDLPENIEVDIAVLDDFDKSITVADLKIPSGVELLTPEEELVAKVEPPRSEEELEELDAPIDEEAELPEDVKEDQEVVDEKQETQMRETNKDEGADPS